MSGSGMAGFSLRFLAAEVVREHGADAGGQGVEAIVRDVDRRVPEGMGRVAYLEGLAAVVRDVMREEGRRSWNPPAQSQPAAPEPAREPPVPAAVPAVVAGEVLESAVPDRRADGPGELPGDGVEPGAGRDALEDAAEAAVPPVSKAARCPVTELPSYSCSHCTGRAGGDGEDEEFKVGREIRERIEAGTSREEAVSQVMASLPHADGPLAGAARAAMLRTASKIERQIARETERAALAGGGASSSLERAAAAIRIGDTPFKLPTGESVRWGSARRSHHMARIAFAEAVAAEHRADSVLHRRAVTLMDARGAGCLDDIPGWEGEIGQLPAAEGAEG